MRDLGILLGAALVGVAAYSVLKGREEKPQLFQQDRGLPVYTPPTSGKDTVYSASGTPPKKKADIAVVYYSPEDFPTANYLASFYKKKGYKVEVIKGEETDTLETYKGYKQVIALGARNVNPIWRAIARVTVDEQGKCAIARNPFNTVVAIGGWGSRETALCAKFYTGEITKDKLIEELTKLRYGETMPDFVAEVQEPKPKQPKTDLRKIHVWVFAKPEDMQAAEAFKRTLEQRVGDVVEVFIRDFTNDAVLRIPFNMRDLLIFLGGPKVNYNYVRVFGNKPIPENGKIHGCKDFGCVAAGWEAQHTLSAAIDLANYIASEINKNRETILSALNGSPVHRILLQMNPLLWRYWQNVSDRLGI